MKYYISPKRKTVKKAEKDMSNVKFVIWLLIALSAYMYSQYEYRKVTAQTTEIEQVINEVKAEPVQIEEVQPEVEIPVIFRGQASYYSHDGCVGCSENQTMANGEPFVEMNYTLAFNRLPLNTWVKVTNTANSKVAFARVTDTGGFEKLGRIADLSKGLKEVINCTDLCQVEVEEVK